MAKVTIVEDVFGTTTQPITGAQEAVKRFTFSNENGLSVQVSIAVITGGHANKGGIYNKR